MLATNQMLQLPNALKARGLDVFVVDGWANRGASGLPMATVRGSIAHWIVSPNRPQDASKNMTLGLIVNGHSTLAGPLANLYLRGDGAVGVVAGGRANHGGVGSWKGVSGNQFFIGTEAEGPPFSDAQMAAYPKILAAVYDVSGQHPRDWGISHQEYAPNRKVDIGPAIIQIRNEAVRLVDNNIFGEDDMTPQQAGQLNAVYEFLMEQERPEGQGYSWAHANNNELTLVKGVVDDISTRLRVPGYPFDWLPHIVNTIVAQGKTEVDVDVDVLAASLKATLADDIVQALAEKLTS